MRDSEAESTIVSHPSGITLIARYPARMLHFETKLLEQIRGHFDRVDQSRSHTIQAPGGL